MWFPELWLICAREFGKSHEARSINKVTHHMHRLPMSVPIFSGCINSTVSVTSSDCLRASLLLYVLRAMYSGSLTLL